jgi:hypothetical protein
MNISFLKKRPYLWAWGLISLLACINGNTYAVLNIASAASNTNTAKNTFPLPLKSAFKRTLWSTILSYMK